MNDNLKNLMLQAGYAAPELAGRANKLAELIVRECADLVKDFHQEDEFTCYSAKTEIKEHFGVEE